MSFMPERGRDQDQTWGGKLYNTGVFHSVKSQNCFPTPRRNVNLSTIAGESRINCYRRSISRQLVDAVGYLHTREIAHRDLKCENIMLSDKDTIKIADFGFARWCCDLVTRKRVLSDTFCGSAAYAAPEILQGIKYNPKMYDVWSLGCILFIMICGTMPFDDKDIKKMMKIQTLRRLTFPSRSNLSTRVKRLIM
ncbi:unnamed protein product [Nesidiocoris tenuis]|uniref:Protein kinase domain-containing protein n=1 Tax=Nesidiocoris tenuis TaxID=355587 RepID=A0A6H5GXP7_9HEMI|nr:unnamed protein product [Nesidiocoris tenuis]